MCVRFDPNTLGDYFAPGFWTPKTWCDRSGIREMLTVGRNLDRTRQPLSTYLCYCDSF
jgi:hypothetical protein